MASLTAAKAMELASGEYANQRLWTLFGYAVPLGWGTDFSHEGLTVRNGTVFFVKSPTALFGVTAAHVVEGFLQQKRETPDTICQLGDVEFDLSSALIDHAPVPDISTFRVDERTIAKLKKEPMTGWPPTPPQIGKGIMYCGYPGLQRDRLAPKEFSFGLYGANNVAHAVDDQKITAVVDHDNLVLNIGQMPPRGYDIGGMSGGPVLTVIENHGLESWRLGGVISQGLTIGDILYAARADAIQADGSVRR